MLQMCWLQTLRYFRPSQKEAGTRKRKKKVRRRKRAKKVVRTKSTIVLKIKWFSLY
jgi:hypothetical protein